MNAHISFLEGDQHRLVVLLLSHSSTTFLGIQRVMAGLAPPQTSAASTVRPSMTAPGIMGNVRMNVPVGNNPYSAQAFPGTVNNYGFNGIPTANGMPPMNLVCR